ncbi:MAG: peroxidase [Acidobacteria bacterium]|nr:MAG: peroxidase [Acidobacteriota bacterium]
MPRLGHGTTIKIEDFREATAEMADRTASVRLAFAAGTPVDPTRLDYLFPDLADDAASLLPESSATVQNLARLGRAMRDPSPGDNRNAPIPAAYTYLGQFIDHDVTLEAQSASLTELLNPAMVPLPLDTARNALFNLRTATLDLDSVYGFPAPRVGPRMKIGTVSTLPNNQQIPLTRPPLKGDDNDLPREDPSRDPRFDRAALIGDPRNDENTIVAQLHLAFLKAHNALVDRGMTFADARTTLRQHYQHMVLYDFLPKVADPAIVTRVTSSGPMFYKSSQEPFFLPLEFAVAAYRFGHTMVRGAYNFNVNFNFRGAPATPATLPLLFTFTALTGQLGFPNQQSNTLPENWIIQWEEFFPANQNVARRLDTHLVEPLFQLTNTIGEVETEGGEDAKRLAVRNLLRGYLLRMPTGQAVANKLGITPMTASQIEAAADSAEQATILRESGFNTRTPLWYYVLVEANALGNGAHLGPVGSTLVVETMVGLVQRSEDSILRTPGWKPSLGQSGNAQAFELPDLLRLAGVLAAPASMAAAAGL